MPTDLELAQDAATGGPVLAQLAKAKEPNVLRAVAANPNAPREVLLKLVERFPDEVLGNPALPLLRLESPNLWEEVPFSALPAVCGSPACPLDLAEWAIARANSNQAIDALIDNAALPLQVRRGAFLATANRRYTFNKYFTKPRDLPGLKQSLGADFFALLKRAGFAEAFGDSVEPDPGLGEAELRELAGYGGLGRELALDHPNAPVDLRAASRRSR